MNNENDNFDAPWSAMKEQVGKVRDTDRRGIHTMENLPPTEQAQYSSRVMVGGGYEDGATIYFSSHGFTSNIHANATDLRTIAAHCIAAAEEVDSATKAMHNPLAVLPNIRPETL